MFSLWVRQNPFHAAYRTVGPRIQQNFTRSLQKLFQNGHFGEIGKISMYPSTASSSNGLKLQPVRCDITNHENLSHLIVQVDTHCCYKLRSILANDCKNPANGTVFRDRPGYALFCPGFKKAHARQHYFSFTVFNYFHDNL